MDSTTNAMIILGAGIIFKKFGEEILGALKISAARIRNEADAQSYATRVTGIAEAEVEQNKRIREMDDEARKILLFAQVETTIEERALERNKQLEIKRQSNLESIANKAIKYLPIEDCTAPIDEDWRTKFFNIAADIGKEEMQEWWAKLLAGEVASPGKYSLRTLDTLKNLTVDEARWFKELCTFKVIVLGKCNLVLGLDRSLRSIMKHGFSFEQIMAMRTSGLLDYGDDVEIRGLPAFDELEQVLPPPEDIKPSLLLQIDDKLLCLTKRGAGKGKVLAFQVPIIPFTPAGTELSKLCTSSINKGYINDMIADLYTMGIDAEWREKQ